MDCRKKIRAIFFDIDDTLYSTSQFTEQARKNAVEAMTKVGLKMPAEYLYKELKEIIGEFTSNYPYHFDKLLLRIPPETYTGINKAILIASAIAAYHDTKTDLKPYPDACRLLEYLFRFPIIKGIITDGLETKQAEKLIRLNLYKYFHPAAIFISDQIGICKPNPKLYRYVCQKAELKPDEIIYLGDNPERDIDPANQVGMITVRIRKETKYSSIEGKTKPCYEITNFEEMIPILETKYALE